MQTTLAAIAVVTVGYIFAYLLFDRLRDRYGYVGGAEYVIIGFLLGPQVSGLLNAGQVQDLTPIVSLALGWLGMLLGTNYPMGPLSLLDFVGLDTTYYIANILSEEMHEPKYAPPPLLKQMVTAGFLGRKSGRGFYDYAAGEQPPRG